MILAMDVDYRNDRARTAGLCFAQWKDDQPTKVLSATTGPVKDYVPGEFYRRELPCLIALIQEHGLEPDSIVIDGYVFLDGSGKPGLGKHLFDALDQKTAVIGVAKNPFRDIPKSYGLCPGESRTPLYITAAGLPRGEAVNHIASMAGAYRIPTLLKKADQHCRAWNSTAQD